MIQFVGIVMGAALAAGGLVVPEAAADQATAEAAVDAFTQRMLDAGFVVDRDDDVDDDVDVDDDDVDVDDDDVDVDGADDFDDDDVFDDCLAASGIPGPDDPDAPIPGATAEAESPELEFSPPGEPASTDVFDFSVSMPESISVMVTTVDDTGVDLMARLVDWMGSKDAAACFERSVTEGMFDTEGEDDIGLDIPPPEFEFTNTADLGVGERSARIDMSLSMVFIVEIEMDMTMLMAQSGRSMAMLSYVTGADGPSSGIDPIAEIQAVIDDLAA